MSMYPYPYGTTVVVHRQTVTGQDSMGVDIVSRSDIEYTGCGWWPTDGNSTAGNEADDFRDTVTSGLTVVLPYDADVKATDTITTLGLDWEVVGVPTRWQNIFTGAAPGCVVLLRRVTG